MQREISAGAARRSTLARRRVAWLSGSVVVLAGVVAIGLLSGPVGPPPERPPGAGLPPISVPRPANLAEGRAPGNSLRAEIAEEEARIAALRAARARLEAEVATLRDEAEERRRTMPGRKVGPDNLAAGPAVPMPPASGGGAPEPAPRALRVFVHHRVNSPPGATAAEEVAQNLRGAGVEVPAIRTSPFVPSTPVVRYFHEEDQAAAARLAGRLGRGWAIQDFRAFVPQPPPQTLEVWLPAN